MDIFKYICIFAPHNKKVKKETHIYKMKRILLKLSGEAIEGDGKSINPGRLRQYATDILETQAQGVQIAIVIGGGNIYRGLGGSVDRVQGDYMGMLATLINSMALQDALRSPGGKDSSLLSP